MIHIKIAGDDQYWDGYNIGEKFEKTFPDIDSYDFGQCLVSYGPDSDHLSSGIENVVMVQQGCNDDQDWIWHITLGSGEVIEMSGGCDYTGWDCRSWGD